MQRQKRCPDLHARSRARQHDVETAQRVFVPRENAEGCEFLVWFWSESQGDEDDVAFGSLDLVAFSDEKRFDIWMGLSIGPQNCPPIGVQ